MPRSHKNVPRRRTSPGERALRTLFPSRPRCDPFDPMSFWEWDAWVRIRNKIERFGTDPREAVDPARSLTVAYLTRLRSCVLLKELCRKYPAEKLHPIFWLLCGILSYEWGREHRTPRRSDRDDPNRHWAEIAKLITATIRVVEQLPASTVREKMLTQLLGVKADAEANMDAPGVRILHGPDGTAAIRFILKGHAAEPHKALPKRGRPRLPVLGAQDLCPAEITSRLALLAHCLRELTGGQRHWRLTRDLAYHFCPGDLQHTTPAQIRARVNAFRRKNRATWAYWCASLAEVVRVLLSTAESSNRSSIRF